MEKNKVPKNLPQYRRDPRQKYGIDISPKKAGLPLALYVVLVIICVGTIFNIYRGYHPSRHYGGPGVLVRNDPVIRLIPDGHAWRAKRYIITPLANFHMRGRVLSIMSYKNTDSIGDIVPFDVALGWGPMSDKRILDQLTITQGDRWYIWRYSGDQPPIPVEDISENSSNFHLVPANEQVRKKIEDLAGNEIIFISGYLISIAASDGVKIVSSLTKNGEGQGACKVVWVEDIVVQ